MHSVFHALVVLVAFVLIDPPVEWSGRYGKTLTCRSLIINGTLKSNRDYRVEF
jgi:hypothetical protein